MYKHELQRNYVYPYLLRYSNNNRSPAKSLSLHALYPAMILVFCESYFFMFTAPRPFTTFYAIVLSFSPLINAFTAMHATKSESHLGYAKLEKVSSTFTSLLCAQ